MALITETQLAITQSAIINNNFNEVQNTFIADPMLGTPFDADLQLLPNGGYVIAFTTVPSMFINSTRGQTLTDAELDQFQLYVQVYDENGESIAPPIQVDTGDGLPAFPTVEVLNDGSFNVRWSEYGTPAGIIPVESELTGDQQQTFDTSGNPVGDIVDLELFNGLIDASPVNRVTLSDGTVAELRVDIRQFEPNALFFDIISPTDPSDIKSYELFTDLSYLSYLQSVATINVLSGERLLVSWEGNRQLFGADGYPLGDVIEVSSLASGSDVNVFELTDGTLAVFSHSGDYFSSSVPHGNTTYLEAASNFNLSVFQQEEAFTATDEDDQFILTTDDDMVFAFGGNDSVVESDGDDIIYGGAGNDILRGGEGNDSLYGGLDFDKLHGGNGDDFIFGGPSLAELGSLSYAARNEITAGAGNDVIRAGQGNDLVFGQDGDDTIFGEFGADKLVGQNGNDVIAGGGGSDVIFGGAGDDFINGGFATDRINGGDGADRFFNVSAQNFLGMYTDVTPDWIQDYDAAEGDLLFFGNLGASEDDFQVNYNHTSNAQGERSGDNAVAEAFVIYRPTGDIAWALVDGAGQTEINIQLIDDTGASFTFDVLG